MCYVQWMLLCVLLNIETEMVQRCVWLDLNHLFIYSEVFFLLMSLLSDLQCVLCKAALQWCKLAERPIDIDLNRIELNIKGFSRCLCPKRHLQKWGKPWSATQIHSSLYCWPSCFCVTVLCVVLTAGYKNKEDFCWRTFSQHHHWRRQAVFRSVWKSEFVFHFFLMSVFDMSGSSSCVFVCFCCDWFLLIWARVIGL